LEQSDGGIFNRSVTKLLPYCAFATAIGLCVEIEIGLGANYSNGITTRNSGGVVVVAVSDGMGLRCVFFFRVTVMASCKLLVLLFLATLLE
jgi:hypothetical protein